MKSTFNTFLIFALCLLLSGCLSANGRSFNIDFNSGIAEYTFHDIKSFHHALPNDATTPEMLRENVASDWESLKSISPTLEDPEYGHERFMILSGNLFQDKNALGQTFTLKVKCLECFASKADMLNEIRFFDVFFLDDKDSDVSNLPFSLDSNSNITLTVNSLFEILSTNGKISSGTEEQSIVWAKDISVLNYRIKRKNDNSGESLLPFYLKDKKTNE